MRTGKELADMIERIPNDVLGAEIKRYFMIHTGVSEVRWVMEQFLENYVSQKPRS